MKIKHDAGNSDRGTSIVRVGRNFQVTIPNEIRKRVAIAEGDYIKTSTRNGQIIFSPIEVIQKRFSGNEDEKEWDVAMLKNFLDGYDPADSAYDTL